MKLVRATWPDLSLESHSYCGQCMTHSLATVVTKIRNVSCVEREGPWRIFYQDDKNHWLHGNVDGDMTKSSGSLVMCGRGKEKKATTRHRYILKFIVKK